MKIGKIVLGLAIAFTSTTFAQTESSIDSTECNRLVYLGQKYGGDKNPEYNLKTSVMYYLQAEKICGGFDMKRYDVVLIALQNVIAQEQDPAVKLAYEDTLLAGFQRAYDSKQYNAKYHDLPWAAILAQRAGGDRKKADSLFKAGFDREGVNIHEAYIILRYYNLYQIYAEGAVEARSTNKKVLIEKYFEFSKLITDAKKDASTQTTLNQYFDAVVQSCDDILPDLAGYISQLPQEKEAKLGAVKNFIKILETKECADSKEYAQLIDTLVQIDTTSFDAQYAKAGLSFSKGKWGDASAAYKEARKLTQDASVIEEIDYKIFYCKYKSGGSVFNEALNYSGKYRGDALKIAAIHIANNANNCGVSTFERKCNYYYAYEIAEKARAAGADASGLMNSYKANWPSDDDIFTAGKQKGQSVTLSCYGVSVTIR